ncbi:uncharacterized protein LOC110113703 [Dendrobium catenatum]|uniref:uncharacterized protein LOC110113703 n=1 Tax=Dendrobium catenatum TaxID=906689 RepID=UPI0009F19018|nr:uncharacterized protein LOC110113703 [Dendrobium catenatum]
MDPSWKETIVVLIPKVMNPDHPSKFRPISLCQTIYKIVAKVLVNRIKGVLPLLVSDEQAAFVPGRSISNHCLLGQELMNKFKVSKSALGLLALKVDMEQAYDNISWRTLELVLRRMGFPARFSYWGCPLSPYLFILYSKLLSAHIHQNYKKLGVPICGGRPPVSHLLYADDILLFAGATIPNVIKITSIMEKYCSWTGQRVNRSKSALLFSKMTSSSTKSRLSKMTGCRKVEEMEYLGIRLVRRLVKKDFGSLVQHAHTKTLAWGIRHLSLIEKICRSFLWDYDSNHRSIHYMAWKSVARPRRLGGLGFQASEDWIGPLRARIAWDISKLIGLFYRFMSVKYGRWPWTTDVKRGDSAVWKLICDGARSLSSCIRWWVCNGRSIDVLNHIWIWDRFIASWPKFCNIEEVENRMVADLMMLEVLLVVPPTPKGWLKINVDGALQRSNVGGIGIVIRDSMGKLIVAAGWSVLHWDSTQVEMMAIQFIEKLIVEWMLELKGVIVEGDNASVIEYFQKFKHNELWKIHPEDVDKWSWMKLLQQVLFIHTNRRFNMAAHFCAQGALEDSFLWDIEDRNICSPQEFFNILEDDSSSLSLD